MDRRSGDHPLQDFYSDIYPTYDRVNRIFTFGRDVSWRRRAARACLEEGADSILDVCTLPSTNRTEAYGMVQLEAMSCGTPMVTSNLPGMRQPVLMTGMGKLFLAQDEKKLTEAILDVLNNPDGFKGDTDNIRKEHSPEVMAQEYIELFEKLINEK